MIAGSGHGAKQQYAVVAAGHPGGGGQTGEVGPRRRQRRTCPEGAIFLYGGWPPRRGRPNKGSGAQEPPGPEMHGMIDIPLSGLATQEGAAKQGKWGPGAARARNAWNERYSIQCAVYNVQLDYI